MFKHLTSANQQSPYKEATVAKSKNITAPVPKPTTRIVYDSKPASKAPRTSRREYGFMRNYSLICIPQGTGSFGPLGGVAQ